MIYTWGQAKDELGRVLQDTSSTQLTWSQELRLDAYNHALEVFAFHTAVATATGWTADGSSSFETPDNLVDMAYIFLWDETHAQWWKPARPKPGSTKPDPTPTGGTDYCYYEWPTGTIQLASVPAESSPFIIYYFSYYDTLVDDGDPISIPRWSRMALLNYSAGYCMNPSATAASRIGQFKQKVDSGNPEHNPFERRQKAYFDLYYRALSEHAPQEKAPPYLGLRL